MSRRTHAHRAMVAVAETETVDRAVTVETETVDRAVTVETDLLATASRKDALR